MESRNVPASCSLLCTAQGPLGRLREWVATCRADTRCQVLSGFGAPRRGGAGWGRDVRTGPVWGRGGAMELTVSLASGVQPGVERRPLGADATCWNRRRKRPGWLAPSQAPSTPHFAPSVQGSVLASRLSQRGLQWAREPGTCRVFLFCSLRNDSSSNRAALLFRSSALTCKYLNFFAFRYRETCLVFLFFFFPPSFPRPSTMLSFTVVSPGFVFYFICLSVSSLWPSLSSTPVPCEILTYHSRDLLGVGGRGSILL